MQISLLYSLPMWIVGLLFVGILSIALEAGFRVGLARREVWHDADSGGGAIAQTSMFALLGLIVAFTYASAVSRHDARKQAVLVESNAMSTAFQRADVIVEPGRTELKQVLLDYARTRSFPSDAQQSIESRTIAVEKTLEQQAKIWPATKRVVEQNNPAPTTTSLVAAINSVFDAHTMRVAAAFDTLPKTVMWMLLFVAAASLSVAGYNAGIQGRMSRWRMAALTLVLTALMIVILDFDRSLDGMVTISQNSIDLVIAGMDADLKH
jgi:hypothetical protein